MTAYHDAFHEGDDDGVEDVRHPRFLVDGRLPPRFERRTVVIPPGRTRGYEESEWRGAIVVVQRGQVELRGDDHERDQSHARDLGGGRGQGDVVGGRRFGRGDILWLDGLPIRALHNPGREPAVLVAVSRRDPAG